MADEKPQVSFEQLRKNQQLRLEERITFETPYKEECGGVVKNINESGGLLITMEKLSVGTELGLTLKLILGEEQATCYVTAQVFALDRKVGLPLYGYDFKINPTNPDAVKQMFHDLSQPKVSAKIPDPSEPEILSSPPSPPVEETPSPKLKATNTDLKPKPEKKKPKIVEANFPLPNLEKKSSSPGTIYWLIGILIIGLGTWGLRWNRSLNVGDIFPKDLPLVNFSIEGGTLMAKVNMNWAQQKSKEQRISQLQQLLPKAAQKNIHAILMTDEGDKLLARVLINDPQQLQFARIEVFNP